VDEGSDVRVTGVMHVLWTHSLGTWTSSREINDWACPSVIQVTHQYVGTRILETGAISILFIMHLVTHLFFQLSVIVKYAERQRSHARRPVSLLRPVSASDRSNIAFLVNR
jgi:hypothetical protein